MSDITYDKIDPCAEGHRVTGLVTMGETAEFTCQDCDSVIVSNGKLHFKAPRHVPNCAEVGHYVHQVSFNCGYVDSGWAEEGTYFCAFCERTLMMTLTAKVLDDDREDS